MNAYTILRHSRRESGNIPLTEILAYINHFEIIGTKIEFITIIQGLDSSEKLYFKNKEKEEEEKETKNNVNIKLKGRG